MRSDVKARWRAASRRVREALTASAREHKCAALCGHLMAFFAATGYPRLLAGYAALPGEVRLDVALDALRRRGTVVLFPRRRGRQQPLAFVAVGTGTAWRQSGSLWEPDGVAVPEHEIDTILVPGLAFDADGTRLGYGGGYYDRTLPNLQGRRLGIAFAVQRWRRLPRAAHDQHVEVVIDERGAWGVGREGAAGGTRRV